MVLHGIVRGEEQAFVVCVMTKSFVLIIIVKKSGFKTLLKLFSAYDTADGNILIYRQASVTKTLDELYDLLCMC